MSIFDAIQAANAYLLKSTGVVGDPEMVRLVDRLDLGVPQHWLIVYNFKLFFPDSDVVDDGSYAIIVNCETGVASTEDDSDFGR